LTATDAVRDSPPVVESVSTARPIGLVIPTDRRSGFIPAGACRTVNPNAAQAIAAVKMRDSDLEKPLERKDRRTVCAADAVSVADTE
jgi:hypothetical protein